MAEIYKAHLGLISDVETVSGGTPAGQAPVSADHLAYMADMIAEMQDLARRGRFDTLATILGLAGVEAARQVETLRKP